MQIEIDLISYDVIFPKNLKEVNLMSNENRNFVEVWEDNVKIKDLLLAMVLCIVFSLGGYIIAPGEAPQPLIFGLSGGVIGFIISSIVIKPKRKITYLDKEEE